MLNNFCVMGRLTADPELRYTPDNTPVTSFRIACDRNFKNAAGEVETDFFNVTAWRQKAEFISKYFVKGQMISIEGSIQQRKYEDKDGNRRTAFEVVAAGAHFCGGKKENGTCEPPNNTGNGTGSENNFVPDFGGNGNAGADFNSFVDDGDDLPFI